MTKKEYIRTYNEKRMTRTVTCGVCADDNPAIIERFKDFLAENNINPEEAVISDSKISYGQHISRLSSRQRVSTGVLRTFTTKLTFTPDGTTDPVHCEYPLAKNIQIIDGGFTITLPAIIGPSQVIEYKLA